MKIFNSLEQIVDVEESVIALGNFDGVHLGHQKLIFRAVRNAKSAGKKSAVFTFSNHPLNVISGKSTVKNVITFEEKADLLSKLGVEYLFSFEFCDYIRKSSPYDFCKTILVDSLQAQEVFCGFNYRFGYKAEGTPHTLTGYGLELGFKTTVIDPVTTEGTTVSSTNIRNAVAAGEMDKYLLFTGRRYAIKGHVIKGLKFGRRIGFPTINLALDPSMIMPKSGVYVTQTTVDGEVHDSITNVGNKPTIGIFEKNAETHIFGFSRNIYGQDVRIEFIKMLRSEMAFNSFEALTSQIEIDCRKAKEYHVYNNRREIK
ncbi:MAG: bifunctional riboflavin kinase/FAD synthetase [Candidatus Moranbacteria bacterium]|nr:bifunctional riboflavin kinase/FAD synthetase [Candidatus Moranbacteria bacterium]